MYIINKRLSCVVSKKIEKMLSQAYEYVEDENYDDAIRIYDIVLKQEPQNVSALIDKGVTLQNIGKLSLAIKSYDKALSESPDNIDALVNKGSALHSSEKYSQAIECYDAALKIDKKCAMALAYKGLSLGEMGELQNAIKHFKKALSIDSQFELASISKQIAQDLLKSIKAEKKTQLSKKL